MARSKKGKRTFQPNTSRRAKRHGFLTRMATKDGRQVKGFLCEQYAVSGARDISGFGGWREYLTATEEPTTGDAR